MDVCLCAGREGYGNLPGRVVDALDELFQPVALRLGEDARLLVASREVDVHVAHLAPCVCSPCSWALLLLLVETFGVCVCVFVEPLALRPMTL